MDGTTVPVNGSKVIVGNNAGNLIAGNARSSSTPSASHADYTGPIDGVKQTFTWSGTCGSVRLENPVTGAVSVLSSANVSDTIINSDKGVGFQIVGNDFGEVVTDINNADCAPGGWTQVSISSEEDVQLRSDLDTAPVETIKIIWTESPPPAKQILLAWAGQRVILEHDWRINSGGVLAYDVDSDSTPADPHPAAGNLRRRQRLPRAVRPRLWPG